MAAEQARRPVQGDAARAHGAALRFVLDRLLRAVQVEGLARQVGRRDLRRGDHGQDRLGTVWLDMGYVFIRDIYG